MVLDPTDGDFSITINGKKHWWIQDEAVIIIADYIEKRLKKKIVPMKRGYKMYGIVCNKISSLQKGIQFGKSIVEYVTKYGSNEPYKKWSSGDKQVMLYDGGNTNSRRFDGKYVGSMKGCLDELDSHKIESVSFYEKDLGDQLTCICLLLDERVWDIEKFNDYDGPFIDKHRKEPSQIPYNYWRSKFGNSEEEINKIFFLRKFFKELKTL